MRANILLKLVSNNETRWNSIYDMLVRALKLKVRFQAYCENWKPPKKVDDDDEYNLLHDKLSPAEWDGVEKVIKVLCPLKKITKQVERREKSLQDVIPYYDWILKHLYTACQEFERQAEDKDQNEISQWLYVCAEAAWDKANTLYGKIGDSPAYYTARVVNPRLKFQWFEQRWGTDDGKRKWVQGAKEVVIDHWRTYRSRYRPQEYSGSSNQQANLGDSDRDDTCDSLGIDEYCGISYDSNPAQHADGFEEYITSDPDKKFQLHEWRLTEQKYPDLVRFALDHAAVPISTSDCERSFSSAKFSLNPLRARMKSDLFEALETLRAWYLQDLARKQTVENEQAEEEEEQIIAEALDD